ncbi:MAG: hypothetical protein NVS3B10_08000 [Polyangiales bacterium]
MRSTLVAVSIAAGSLAVATSASGAVHPRVILDAADVPAVRTRLDGPLKPLRDALASGVNEVFDGGGVPSKPDLGAWSALDDRRAIADTLLSFAFARLVFKGGADAKTADRARQVAHDYLIGICDYGDWVFAADQGADTPDLYLAHMMFDVTLAYDWVGDELTDAERATCRARVATESAKMFAVGKLPDGGAWWIDEYLQNHQWINNAALGMVALGFEGELDGVDTKPWYDNTVAALGKSKSVIDPIAGGAWHEGIGYTNYGVDSLTWFSLANVKLKGGEDFADNGLVHDYARMRMFGMPPAKAHRREYVVYGDWSGYDGDEGALGFFWYHAKKKHDAEVAWYAQQFLDGEALGKAGVSSWPPSHRSLILAALNYDDALAAKAPAGVGGAWNLDYHAKDLSLFTARSGWTDNGALLAFKTGVFGGHWNFDRLKIGGAPGGNLDFGHDHDDDMNVWLFADGEWLTLNVPGYWIGRVNGDPEANRTKYANSMLVDGQGQLGDGPRNDGFKGPGNEWFFERTSSIPLTGSTAHYSYVLGAGAGLYDKKLGLDAWGRAILFVDRQLPVVRDVIKAAAPHRFELLWHAVDAVEQDGPWLKLHAKNDRLLGVKVVAPAKFTLATEVQSGLRHEDKFDPDGEMTAAMVRPETDVAATTVLEVLVPSRGSTWASKPAVDAIDPAALDHGVKLHLDAADSRVVFADAPDTTVATGDLSVTGMAGVVRATGGKTDRAMLAAGSALTLAGTRWIEILAGAPASIELEPSADGASLAVSGEAKQLRAYAPGVRSVTYNGATVDFDRDGDFVILPKAGGSLPDAGGVPDGGPSLDGGVGSDAGGPASAAPVSSDGSGGGCGCSVPSGAPSWVEGLGVVALAILARTRRARRRAPSRAQR